jgi:hypothetical protein
MKKLLILLTSTLLGCANALDEAQPDANFLGGTASGLVGTWKLTEYLADPGDGSGKYQKAEGRFNETVEFRADGRFVATTDLGLSQSQQFEYYKVLDNQRIELIYKANTNGNPSRIWTYSDLTATTLTLSYGCIEPCRGKYVRVK